MYLIINITLNIDEGGKGEIIGAISTDLFEYEMQGTEICITKYIGSDAPTVTEIVIPETIDGYNVTSIYGEWEEPTFGECDNLTTISLPSTMKYIGCTDEIFGYDEYGNPDLFTRVTFTLDSGTAVITNIMNYGYQYRFNDGSTVEETDFDMYVSNSGEDAYCTITGYTGLATEIMIPDEIYGIPVKAIGSYAFDNVEVSTLTLNDGMEWIDTDIFGDGSADAIIYFDELNLAWVDVVNNGYNFYCDDVTQDDMGPWIFDYARVNEEVWVDGKYVEKNVVSIYGIKECSDSKLVIPDKVFGFEVIEIWCSVEELNSDQVIIIPDSLQYAYFYNAVAGNTPTAQLTLQCDAINCFTNGNENLSYVIEGYENENFYNLSWVLGSYEDSDERFIDITGVVDEKTVTEIVIPANLCGYPVTDISYCAFENCDSLKSVTLPDSIEYFWYIFGEGNSSGKTIYVSDSFIDFTHLFDCDYEYQVGDYAQTDFEIEYYSWTNANGESGSEFSITGYTGTSKNIVVPEKIYGIPVDNIYDGAFSEVGGLISVEIPASIYCGNDIFGEANREAILRVDIQSDMVMSLINDSEYYGQYYPNYEIIGYENEEVDFDMYIRYEYDDEWNMIEDSQYIVITGYSQEDAGIVTSLVIPQTIYGLEVKSIESWAFENCVNLTSLTIPITLESVEWGIFDYRDNETIYLYQGTPALTDIKDYGYNYEFIEDISAGSLYNVELRWVEIDGVSSKVVFITDYVGEEEGFITITIPEEINGYPIYGIDSGVFAWCYDLETIIVPDSISYIGNCYPYSYETYVVVGKDSKALANESIFEDFKISGSTSDYVLTFVEDEDGSGEMYLAISQYYGEHVNELVLPSGIEGMVIEALDQSAFSYLDMYEEEEEYWEEDSVEVDSYSDGTYLTISQYDDANVDELVLPSVIGGMTSASLDLSLNTYEEEEEYYENYIVVKVPDSYVYIGEDIQYSWYNNLIISVSTDSQAYKNADIFSKFILSDVASDYEFIFQRVGLISWDYDVNRLMIAGYNGDTDVETLSLQPDVNGDTIYGIVNWAFEFCYDLECVEVPSTYRLIERYALGWSGDSDAYALIDSTSYAFRTNNIYCGFVIDGYYEDISYSITYTEQYLEASDEWVEFYSLSHYIGDDKEIVEYLDIPRELYGLEIGGISYYCFTDCTSLSSIKIEDNIRYLSWSIFGNRVVRIELLSTYEDAYYSIMEENYDYICTDTGEEGTTCYYEVYEDANGDEYIVITGYKYEYSENIVIPASIMNIPVTEIADYVFVGMDNSVVVEIPYSVTSIGQNLFNDWTWNTIVLYEYCETELVDQALENANCQVTIDSYYNQFCYTLIDDEVVVSDILSGYGRDIMTVPSTVGSYPVVGIESWSLANLQGTTSIKLPDTLEWVGYDVLGDSDAEVIFSLSSLCPALPDIKEYGYSYVLPDEDKETIQTEVKSSIDDALETVSDIMIEEADFTVVEVVELVNTAAIAVIEAIGDNKETVQDSAEIIEQVAQIDELFVAANAKISYAETTPTVDEKVSEEDQLPDKTVEVSGLAVATLAGTEVTEDTTVSLVVEQNYSDVEGTLNLDIKPYIQVGEAEAEVIANEDISAPITFKVYLSSSFQGKTVATVRHVTETFVEYFYTLPIQEDSNGDIYIELTVSEFSIFEVTAVSDTEGEDGDESGHTPGDIDGDGKVDNLDVTSLFQYVSGWNVEDEIVVSACDVDNNGSVNNLDVTLLFQYVSGWTVTIY